jgi:hypothetical protein
LAACTTVWAARKDPTPTPEVFIPRTMVVPDSPTISGRALWGATPVAGARIELRTGAWADPNNSQSIAATWSDDGGRYQLEAPPNGGEFGLVALWPDRGTNVAPVTPVQVSQGSDLAAVDVYLARELELLAPVSGAEVEATPALSWTGLPGIAAYQLWIVDAGTTELVFDRVITETLPLFEVVAPPLTPGHTYRWSVNGWAQNNADTSASNLLASLSSEFKVKTPDVVALPPSNAADYPPPPALRVPEYTPQAHPGTQVYRPVAYGPTLDSSLDLLRASLMPLAVNRVSKSAHHHVGLSLKAAR